MRPFAALLAAALSSGVAQAEDAPCPFGFDIAEESSALQALVNEADAKGGFWLSVAEAPADVRRIARHVGRLQVCLTTEDGAPGRLLHEGRIVEIPVPHVANCTASLLPEGRLLTNRHCFHGAQLADAGLTVVRAAQVDFGYVAEDRTGEVRTYGVSTEEIASDAALDAMVLAVSGGPEADLGGHVPMRMRPGAEPLQALVMIHHPAGGTLQYSTGTCRLHRRQGELGPASTSLRHTCESTAGSSGALLLDARTLAVVGLHNRGGLRDRADSFNGGHAIGPIEAALSLGFEEIDSDASAPAVCTETGAIGSLDVSPGRLATGDQLSISAGVAGCEPVFFDVSETRQVTVIPNSVFDLSVDADGASYATTPDTRLGIFMQAADASGEHVLGLVCSACAADGDAASLVRDALASGATEGETISGAPFALRRYTKID